jgi:hypothetical protein
LFVGSFDMGQYTALEAYILLGQRGATNDGVILTSSFINVTPLWYGLPLSHDEFEAQ